MAINLFNIKKWTKMLFGKSILHVNQTVGKNYSKDEILGYYNNLTEKVLKSNLAKDELPLTKISDGSEIEFSIAIFQYGLGAYDLFLETNENEYIERFKIAVEWAIKNQDDNGGWKTFSHSDLEHPYSSMAQGEGVSLLLRAFLQFNDDKYFESAKKAINFMIKPLEDGGTALYDGDSVYFKEFYGEPVVLNGWIFSIFGIYDYLLIKKDKKIKDIYCRTIRTLSNSLESYDLGYWSRYDIKKKVASPFYHELHIQLLRVMYDLTGDDKFDIFSKKLSSYSDSWYCSKKAFFIKACQKIKE